jgi:uncharacterized protein YkwD
MRRSGGNSSIVLAVAVSAALLAPSAAIGSTRETAASLLESVNAVRAQHGLSQLHRARALDASALMKAEAIRSCGQFSHTPCGMPVTRTFQRTGYFHGRVRVGENLYFGTGSLGSSGSAVASWLRSPPHRANLLGHWRDTGIGIVHAPSLFGYGDVWLFVMQFGVAANLR